uniref:GPI mannosyltransferase 2 n=1 Tax=Tetraselmis sp. GSL018 TaxID=582737 RepID=A0A061RRB6_9CHLO
MYKNYVQSCEANILLEGLVSRAVFFAAIVSRAVFFAAIIVFDLVFDDYDSSASLGEFGALRSCEIVLESSSQYVRGGEVRTPTRLEGLAVWDSAFFVRIAQCGYEFEQSQAFFPGLPFLCWVLTRTRM